MNVARDHRKNSEGYMDLTAYEAIRRADRDLDRRRYHENTSENDNNNKKINKKKKDKKNITKLEEK